MEKGEEIKKAYTLYTYFRSSTSWRVRIVLHHKNIPFECKFINLAQGEQKNQQFKKVNPNQGVPALVLPDGQILIESVAIIEYLQEMHPEHPLLPKDPVLKAKVRGFCELINSAMHPYQNLRVLEKIAKDYNGDKIQWAKYWVNRGCALLQEILHQSKGKYCFGDNLTLADAFFVPQVQGGAARFGIDLNQYPAVKQVLGNLKLLDQFVKSQPRNQPDFQE